MPATRSSARLASQKTSPAQSETSAAGTKRKTENNTGSSPTAKRGRKSSEKAQTTIEESMDLDQSNDTEAQEAENHTANPTKPEDEMDVDEAPKTQTTLDQQVEEKKEGAKPEQNVQTTNDASQPNNAVEKERAVEQPVVHDSDDKKTENEQPVAENAKQEEPKHEEPQSEAPKHEEYKSDAPKHEESKLETPKHEESKPEEPKHEESKPGEPRREEPKHEQPSQEQPKPEEQRTEAPKHEEPASTHTTNGDAIEPKARDDEIPSSILEKGIIYFFFRPRVNVEDPQAVNDIARSYFVLRPIPLGAKLGDGPIGDAGNCRVIALPKKVLPLSGKDRFLTFVEKAKIGFKDLRENFLSGSEYETQTAGTRHTQPTTPVGEGVYALTSTGRESHLAYILTIPSDLGEVQKDIGLRERGSFITSVKNPDAPSPANASLPQKPEYSEDIKKEFGGLRWMPLQPKLLDYVNTQFLLIGESGGLEKAMEEQPRDQKQDNAAPIDEIQKLEGEDEIRVKNLRGDDSVFADLGLSSKEYPKVPSTW